MSDQTGRRSTDNQRGVRQSDGESGIVIPKSILIGLLITSWGLVGSGGYYMGIQWADKTSMQSSINVLVADKTQTADKLAAITTKLELIQSTTKYGIALARAPKP
jgi:hypothetical protein